MAFIVETGLIVAGANAYITKPIRAPKVIETVRGLLGL